MLIANTAPMARSPSHAVGRNTEKRDEHHRTQTEKVEFQDGDEELARDQAIREDDNDSCQTFKHVVKRMDKKVHQRRSACER